MTTHGDDDDDNEKTKNRDARLAGYPDRERRAFLARRCGGSRLVRSSCSVFSTTFSVVVEVDERGRLARGKKRLLSFQKQKKLTFLFSLQKQNRPPSFFPPPRGKPCVCGVSELSVDERTRTASLGGWDFKEGDELTLDGTAGSVIRGAEPLAPPSVSDGGGENGNGGGGENGNGGGGGGTGSQLATLMRWADERRDLRVLANADTPGDAAVARRNGAEGIGLVRTEHMFFASADRIRAMRELIGAAELAREEGGGEGEGRGEEDGDAEPGDVASAAASAARAARADARAAASASALSRLKAYQREDFAGIFREMRGAPVVVRTLDPPLHEFLPAEGPALDELVESLSKLLAVSREVRAGKRERGRGEGERDFFFPPPSRRKNFN